MKPALCITAVFAALTVLPGLSADQARIEYIQFPAGDDEALGQIDKLTVKVTCSWIANLRNVPELYNLSSGYDIPTENIFEATPRLGAAAVKLSQWSGVIGIRIPADRDAKPCFNVTVQVEGRENARRQWTGSQLGFSK